MRKAVQGVWEGESSAKEGKVGMEKARGGDGKRGGGDARIHRSNGSGPKVRREKITASPATRPALNHAAATPQHLSLHIIYRP